MDDLCISSINHILGIIDGYRLTGDQVRTSIEEFAKQLSAHDLQNSRAIAQLRGELMATLDEVKGKIEEVKASVAAEVGQVKDQVAALIERLTKGGSSVTPADLDKIVESLDSIKTGIDSISNEVVEPTPPVVPPVEVKSKG